MGWSYGPAVLAGLLAALSAAIAPRGPHRESTPRAHTAGAELGQGGDLVCARLQRGPAAWTRAGAGVGARACRGAWLSRDHVMPG